MIFMVLIRLKFQRSNPNTCFCYEKKYARSGLYMVFKLVTRSKINGRKSAAVFVGIYRCNSPLQKRWRHVDFTRMHCGIKSEYLGKNDKKQS